MKLTRALPPLAVVAIAAGCAAPALVGTSMPTPQDEVVFAESPTATSALASAVAPMRTLSADDPPPQGNTPAPVAMPENEADRWRFTAAPYLWLFGMKGSIDKGGHTLDVSSSIQDSWKLLRDHTDAGFAGHFEAVHHDLALFFDANWMKFSGSGGVSREVSRDIGGAHIGGVAHALQSASIDADLQITQMEAGAAWHVADLQFRDSGSKLPVEILGGVRWNELDTSVDLNISSVGARHQFERDFSPSFRTNWFEPFVGARTTLPITDRMSLRLRGDIGGGGIGDSSQRAWNVIAAFTYQITDCVALFAGYRWYDYVRNAEGRRTDMQLFGPGVGVVILF